MTELVVESLLYLRLREKNERRFIPIVDDWLAVKGTRLDSVRPPHHLVPASVGVILTRWYLLDFVPSIFD